MALNKKTTNFVSQELNIYMTKTNIKNFNKAEAHGNLKEHIAEYIKIHTIDGVINEENYYSLLLKAAISLEDVNLVKNILEKIKELNIAFILTSTDNTYHSPVSITLYSNNMKIIGLIDDFIKLEKPRLSKSSTMSRQLISNIILALHATPEGMTIDYCLEHFLIPLYEENVIDILLGYS
jgi:hypothetical protein